MISQPKEQICSITKKLSEKGWMPGSSGGLALLNTIGTTQKSILIAPGNINKANLKTGDLFEIKWIFENQSFIKPILSNDSNPHVLPKLSPIYLLLMNALGAKCVIEASPSWISLATKYALKAWECNAECHPNILRLANWRLLNELSSKEEVRLPIVNYSSNLEDTQVLFQRTLNDHPDSIALLIKDYGILAWGDSIENTLSKIELIDELCKLQIFNHKLLENSNIRS